MLYFDVHAHVGNCKIKLSEENEKLLAYREYSTNTPENCMRKALANSVCKSVIFPFPLMEQPFQKQNDYVLDAAEKYPYFFVPFLIPESIDALARKKDRFVGIKDHFYFDFHNQVNRDEILDFSQETGKLYLFHAHWKHWGGRITKICKDFPRLKVIIAHSARPAPFLGVNIDDTICALKGFISAKLRNNFYFDTSTIRDSSAIERLVEAFGAEHILWGTDFPYYSNKSENIYQAEKNTILNAAISDESKNLIFTKNFRSLLQTDGIWVRQAMRDDSSVLISMLDKIPQEEQKFLALSLKTVLIKKQMKTGGHILVAEDYDGNIVGFLRGSDRHNDCVMIEEVYVLPKLRGQKVATKLISAVLPSYSGAEIKTYASNIGMVRTLQKLNFTPKYSPKGTMISWKK